MSTKEKTEQATEKSRYTGQYVELLKMSIGNIERAVALYRSSISDAERRNDAGKELTYHYFAYSQLVYSLFLYLKERKPEQKNRIENFFRPESVRKVMRSTHWVFLLANRWKHDLDLWLQEHVYITLHHIEGEGYNEVDKIDARSAWLSANGCKRDLLRVFKTAHEEILPFVQEIDGQR